MQAGRDPFQPSMSRGKEEGSRIKMLKKEVEGRSKTKGCWRQTSPDPRAADGEMAIAEREGEREREREMPTPPFCV